MQCPSCEFFNTPGACGCIRCGTRLDLAGIPIEPPRASSIVVVRSVRLVRARAAIALRDALGDSAERVRRALRVGPADWPLTGALVASIVPGLGQWLRHQRLLGGALLGVWVAMTLWALFSMGTDWNWIAVMCMLGTHSTAVNLLLGPTLRRHPPLARAGIGLVVYLALLGGIYWPARIALSRVIFTAPVDQLLANSRIAPGDVLLCAGPWLHGRDWPVGEIVMYTHATQNRGTALAVDRIVAGPGDVVSVSGGTLQVNDKVAPPFLASLRPPDSRLSFTIACPEGCVIIVPSVLRWQAGPGDQAAAQMSRLAEQISIVPIASIQARVLARVRPLTRLGLVD